MTERTENQGEALREAPDPRRGRTLLALSGAAALSMLGVSVAVPRVTSQVVAFSGGDGQIGWIASAFAVSYILLQVPYGNLSDRFGFKPFLVAGYLVSAVAGLVFALAGSSLPLFLGRAIQGAGEAPVWSLAPALLSLLYPERKGWIIGRYSMLLYGGIVVGPLLVPLVPFLDGRGAFWFFAAACLGAAGIVALGVENRRPRGSADSWSLVGAARLLQTRPVRLALLGIGLYGAAQGLFFALIPGFLLARGGFSPVEAGYLLSAMYLGTTLAQFVFGPLSDRRGRRPFMVLGLVVAGAATGTFFLFPKLSSMALLGVGTTGLGCFFVASMAYLNEKAPESLKGTISGAYYLFWGVGYFAGPLLWGVLGRWMGQTLSFVLFGAVLAAQAVLLACFAGEGKTEPAVCRE